MLEKAISTKSCRKTRDGKDSEPKKKKTFSNTKFSTETPNLKDAVGSRHSVQNFFFNPTARFPENHIIFPFDLNPELFYYPRTFSFPIQKFPSHKHSLTCHIPAR